MILKNYRHFFSGLVLLFYLTPVLFFAGYAIWLLPPAKSWPIISFGLLTTAFFSLIFIVLLFKLERSSPEKETPSITQLDFMEEKEPKVTSIELPLSYEGLESSLHPVKDPGKQMNLLETALRESQEEKNKYLIDYESKLQELKMLADLKEQLEAKVQQTAQDFSDYKLFTEEQLRQKQLQIQSLQQMMEEQRGEMEKRQDQIFQLDTKVHDLSYEIKTLLYLNEDEKDKIPTGSSKTILENFKVGASAFDSSLLQEKFIRTAAEGNALLNKCLQMAQKFTGGNYHATETSRYREFTSSNFAIDQRRLYDGLRSEKEGLVLLYSPKEGKLIFSNQQSKILLGWSPDQFAIHFHQIIQEGYSDWKRGIAQLSATPESQIRLLARNKNGQEVMLSCHLGTIPSGLFRNHVIGVLYPI
jgi:hypothetical protein